MNRFKPFEIDPAELSLIGFGDTEALVRARHAVADGIRHAAHRAVSNYPGIPTGEVIIGMRRYLGLDDQPSEKDNPLIIPIISSYLMHARYSDAHVRGLLSEIGRAVVADLAHQRAPRIGIFLRVLKALRLR